MPWQLMHVSRVQPKLLCEEAHDKEDCKLKIRHQPVNPILLGQWPLKVKTVHMCIAYRDEP